MTIVFQSNLPAKEIKNCMNVKILMCLVSLVHHIQVICFFYYFYLSLFILYIIVYIEKMNTREGFYLRIIIHYAIELIHTKYLCLGGVLVSWYISNSNHVRKIHVHMYIRWTKNKKQNQNSIKFSTVIFRANIIHNTYIIMKKILKLN